MKRFFDLFFAVGLGILFSPIIFLISIFIILFLGRPILFKQQRPGHHGKLFTMYKFRTMRDLKKADGTYEEDSVRLTKFGRFLRSTSLDELPELWNVLIGEMSMVGPRPLLVQYLPLYSPEQLRRHEVKPGITGWAQVNGRNSLSWDEKFKLDIWYVDNQSMLLDLLIFFKTIHKVVFREAISEKGEATMSGFRGTNNNHE